MPPHPSAPPATRLVESHAFAAESRALLASLERSGRLDQEALDAGRTQWPGPDLAGRPDPRVEAADVFLPLGGGRTRARLYRAASAAPQSLLLWLHGGGFVQGSVESIDATCSQLAGRSGRIVASVDYRLAPEHPFPAALHDAYDAWRWLAEHGRVLGADGAVAIGGQSAGGNLAAAACLKARDSGGPTPAAQVLCYPWLDLGVETASHHAFDGDFLSVQTLRGYQDLYLAGQDVTSYVSPLQAGDLAGLPPALVIGAGRDPLRDDARRYAVRMHEAGSRVQHLEFADTMHAFLSYPGALSAGPQAIELIADFLNAGSHHSAYDG